MVNLDYNWRLLRSWVWSGELVAWLGLVDWLSWCVESWLLVGLVELDDGRRVGGWVVGSGWAGESVHFFQKIQDFCMSEIELMYVRCFTPRLLIWYESLKSCFFNK